MYGFRYIYTTFIATVDARAAAYPNYCEMMRIASFRARFPRCRTVRQIFLVFLSCLFVTAILKQVTHVHVEEQEPLDLQSDEWRSVPVTISAVTTISLRASNSSIGIKSLRNSVTISVPNPEITRPKYATLPIFHQINDILKNISKISQKKNVLLILSTKDYDIVTVNWICNLNKTAPSLLPHVLLIHNDEDRSRYFRSKGIHSVVVNPHDLFYFNKNMSKRKLSWLWMTRLLIVHYLISQGFDTMSIDSDAVVLQNPFKLLDTLKVDVYMCLAMYPFEISNIWGFTGCAGSTIYRSNPRTFSLFEELSKRPESEVDDQVRLNSALYAMNMSWANHNDIHIGFSKHSKQRLSVAVLPETYICHYKCPDVMDSKELMIVHPRDKAGKLANVKLQLAKNFSVSLVSEEKINFLDATNMARNKWINKVCSTSS